MRKGGVRGMKKGRRTKEVGGMTIVDAMGIGEKRKSVIMVNTGNENVQGHIVDDTEIHRPGNQMMIITSAVAGHTQEAEVVVETGTIGENGPGLTPLENNELQRRMRRARFRMNLRILRGQWVMTRWNRHPPCRRMDLINRSKSRTDPRNEYPISMSSSPRLVRHRPHHRRPKEWRDH
jgi:hypothetical protein